MNSEVCKNILSANFGAKRIGRNFIVQQDNDPKHTQRNATKKFIMGEKVEGFRLANSFTRP